MNDVKEKSDRRWLFGTTLVGLAILGVAYGNRRLSAVQPQSSAPYHERVVEVGESMPRQIGQWLGADMPLDEGAIKILHPNLAISRRFMHVTKGYSADLLIIHVRDARDILGHYPPICYPRTGYLAEESKKRDWTVAGRTIHGMEYHFSKNGLVLGSDLVVYNFLIVKDKPFCRDMEEVQLAAKDGTRKIFGAAQVQVLCRSSMTEEDREQAFQDLIEGNMGVIEAIQKGEGDAERK